MSTDYRLIIDPSGNLYGTTFYGGTAGEGNVFQIAANTHALSTVATFAGANGVGPSSALTLDSAGNLYGATSAGGTSAAGGTSSLGTVYQIAGGTRALTTLVSFNSSRGSAPQASVARDNNGNLFEIGSSSKSLATLAAFNSTTGTPAEQGELLMDGNGNLYGTTTNTIFEFSPATHTFSTLASFTGTNGSFCLAGLTADAAGNLYGTTFYGGSANKGIVFKLSLGTNTLTTLANFTGTNGADAFDALTIDAAGNLFGTTEQGGTAGDGTAFEITAASQSLVTLANFTGTNGFFPILNLTPDAAGNLYGTTEYGGTSNDGIVFELANTGFVVPEPASLAILTTAAPTLMLHRRGRRVDTKR